jgi:hypothetical protein
LAGKPREKEDDVCSKKKRKQRGSSYMKPRDIAQKVLLPGGAPTIYTLPLVLAMVFPSGITGGDERSLLATSYEDFNLGGSKTRRLELD